MAADELGGGVNDDVRAVLDRSDEEGCAEGVVNNDGQSVAVSQLRDRVDVGDVAVGVAERLEIDRSGVVLNRVLDFLEVVRVDKGRCDAVLGQGVCEEVVAAAVDGFLRYDVTAVCCQRLNGVGDRRGARSQRECRAAALESGDSLFENVLRGVGQSAVDVARVRETEAVGGVLRVAENIGGRLINGYRSCVGCGVSLLLTNV